MIGAIDAVTDQDYVIVDSSSKDRLTKAGLFTKPVSFQTYGTIFIVPDLPPSHESSHVMRIAKIESYLRHYLELDAGWDGYQGVPARTQSFVDAISFIKKLPYQAPAPKTMLSGSGEISLYWEDHCRYAEAAFPGDGSFHFIFDAEDSTLVLDDISPESDSLPLEIVKSIGNIHV